MRKLRLSGSGELPFFQPKSLEVQDKTWQVSPVPQRLQCRAVDLGDISPANTELFKKALNSPACGIQVESALNFLNNVSVVPLNLEYLMDLVLKTAMTILGKIELKSPGC